MRDRPADARRAIVASFRDSCCLTYVKSDGGLYVYSYAGTVVVVRTAAIVMTECDARVRAGKDVHATNVARTVKEEEGPTKSHRCGVTNPRTPPAGTRTLGSGRRGCAWI